MTDREALQQIANIANAQLGIPNVPPGTTTPNPPNPTPPSGGNQPPPSGDYLTITPSTPNPPQNIEWFARMGFSGPGFKKFTYVITPDFVSSFLMLTGANALIEGFARCKVNGVPVASGEQVPSAPGSYEVEVECIGDEGPIGDHNREYGAFCTVQLFKNA